MTASFEPANTVCAFDGGNRCNGAGKCETRLLLLGVSPEGEAYADASPDYQLTFSASVNPASVTAQFSAGPCDPTKAIHLASDPSFTGCLGFISTTILSSNTIFKLQHASQLAFGSMFYFRLNGAALTSTAGFPDGIGLVSKTFSTYLADGKCFDGIEDQVVMSQVYFRYAQRARLQRCGIRACLRV